MFLFKNYQYTEESKVVDSTIKKEIKNISLEDLINHQNVLNSSIGTYLMINSNDEMCFLLLSNDKKLANKLGIKNEYDKYTGDMFPINYNEMYVNDILKEKSGNIIKIKHNDDNYFLLLTKGEDCDSMFYIIESYKKRSYTMQKYWKDKKLIVA